MHWTQRADKDAHHACKAPALLRHATAHDDKESSVLSTTTHALFKRLAGIGVLSLLSIFLASCGGGGGGDEKPPEKPPTQEMKWDASNWDDGNWA